ncbi:universal stress protein [Chitinilyticum piscinae]|uniref:Universal stress protein n=1 Tax=Chitinilyticum piscinae TaxID=2866724 RepID=A0A8J7K8B2_9NEIS|nr:universal stress protein [Chitinilyticum piscinae]MBE9609253.1 universal stress protein [Chitinilyticum piscinae]
MYQRIMVPVDDSAAARAAFDQALGLAKLTGAQLYLLHVLDVSRANLAPVGLPGMEFIHYSENEQAATERDQRLLAELAREAELAGIGCETRLFKSWGGNPAKTLLAASEEWGADLIVMGTHGYTGFMHLLFGSVAESLLHYAHVPVLLVRKDDEESDDD